MNDICAVIERETGKKVDEFTALEALPVDSLEFLDLMLAISTETGKSIPDAKMGSLTTVGDIARELV